MKKNKNRFFASDTIRKNKALANVIAYFSSCKNISVHDVFINSNNHQEKLQIIYANIRV